jgi:arylsulfatase A-like enzyme
VVNLLDMYPTLVELCGLPPNPLNEGRSFAPLLKNPKMEWNHPTLTTYHFKNHSLTDGRYRYTWYGGRMEHRNLAANPKYKEIAARFKKFLPAHNEPDSPRNASADENRKKRKGSEPNAD